MIKWLKQEKWHFLYIALALPAGALLGWIWTLIFPPNTDYFPERDKPKVQREVYIPTVVVDNSALQEELRELRKLVDKQTKVIEITATAEHKVKLDSTIETIYRR